jgi:hypothetical protein
MNFLIKTSKPDEIEKELKKNVEQFKGGIELNKKTKFLLKLAHIDPDVISESLFFDYSKIDDNSFKIDAGFPSMPMAKEFFLKELKKNLQKIDKNVKIEEIKE